MKRYHLHYMVLALGTFLVVFGACYSTPISMNYIIECFKSTPLEVAVIMNVYRQILALALPFFILPWERTVSAGWLVIFLSFFSSFLLDFLTRFYPIKKANPPPSFPLLKRCKFITLIHTQKKHPMHKSATRTPPLTQTK